MNPTTRTLTLVYDFRRQGGHAFFRSETGRMAVADDSGRTPDDTDDGILWLDPTRPVRLARYSVGYGARIPLVDDHGNQCHTPTSLLHGVRAAWDFDMKIKASGELARTFDMLGMIPASRIDLDCG